MSLRKAEKRAEDRGLIRRDQLRNMPKWSTEVPKAAYASLKEVAIGKAARRALGKLGDLETIDALSKKLPSALWSTMDAYRTNPQSLLGYAAAFLPDIVLGSLDSGDTKTGRFNSLPSENLWDHIISPLALARKTFTWSDAATPFIELGQRAWKNRQKDSITGKNFSNPEGDAALAETLGWKWYMLESLPYEHQSLAKFVSMPLLGLFIAANYHIDQRGRDAFLKTALVGVKGDHSQLLARLTDTIDSESWRKSLLRYVMSDAESSAHDQKKIDMLAKRIESEGSAAVHKSVKDKHDAMLIKYANEKFQKDQQAVHAQQERDQKEASYAKRRQELMNDPSSTDADFDALDREMPAVTTASLPPEEQARLAYVPPVTSTPMRRHASRISRVSSRAETPIISPDNQNNEAKTPVVTSEEKTFQPLSPPAMTTINQMNVARPQAGQNPAVARSLSNELAALKRSRDESKEETPPPQSKRPRP